MAEYQSKGQNVTVQPPSGGVNPGGQPVLMTAPGQIPGVPPGLEYLTQIDQLLVHQQVEIFEALSGWEMQNKYQVKNSLGQQVFFAAEESGCCMRMCCGPGRGFVMHITDNFGNEVIRAVRDFKCCAGCCWCASPDSCCSMDIRIEAPIGQTVGYLKQDKSGWKPKYIIQDGNEQTVFIVVGPCCPCQGICCTADIEFPLLSLDGQTQVGVISKQWAGALRELFLDADHFSISFPMDLDVRMKATLLGALFLIDFMHFETQKNNK